MRLAPGAALVAVLAAAPAAPAAEEPPPVSELLAPGRAEPLLIAHRGLSARFPENTMAAFRAAADAGAEMLELDVGLSSDGQVVVLHDATLDRTTDGRGELSGQPWSALAALDAGAWFDPAFAGERLPLLSQVLDELGGRIAINVEIKPEAVHSALAGGIEEQVVAMVRQRGLQPRVTVSSFEPGAVARVHRLDPSIRTAVLYHTELELDPVALVTLFGADGLHCNRHHVTAAAVGALHERGLYVGVYTANEAGELRRLRDLGVDAIFTDDVTAAREALAPAPPAAP